MQHPNRHHKTMVLQSGAAFVVVLLSVLVTTFPLCLDLTGYLVPSSGSTIRVNEHDPQEHVRYIPAVREALTGNGGVWSAIHSDPDYAISPTYALAGGVLATIVSPIVAHNLIFLAFEVLAGFAMFLLARRLTQDFWAGLYAGLLYGTSDYLLMYHMGGQGHVIQMGWIPLCFLFLDRLLLNGQMRDALALGVLLSMLLLGSAQYLVFLSVLFPAYLLLLKSRVLWKPRFVLLLAVVLFVFFLTSAPYLWALLRTPPEVFSLLRINRRKAFILNGVLQFLTPSDRLYVGLVPLALALATVGTWRRQQRWLRPMFFLAVLCPIFMMGPFAGWAPYRILYDHWPGFQHIRTPVRLHSFELMFLLVLAAAFVAHLRRHLSGRWRVAAVVTIFVATAATQVSLSPLLARGQVNPAAQSVEAP